VAPLAGDVMQSFEQNSVDDNACTHPSSQNDSENASSILAGTIDGFSKGETVGVILQSDWSVDKVFQIASDWSAIHADCIRILQAPVQL
jgi:hypothetical protein